MRRRRGQSLLEVIVAMSVFALISAALMTLATSGTWGLIQGGDQTEAEALAQEGIEAVRAIRDAAWNTNTYTQSAVATSGGQWVFSGQGTTETIGKFTRTITFADVCRDGTNAIVACPGSSTDVQSKQATVTVTWSPRTGVTNTVRRVTYLTNWDSREWTQTDWAGGSGQTVLLNATQYDSGSNVNHSTAGQVTLAATGGGAGSTLDPGFEYATATSTTWPFTTSSDYTYDSSKIEVTGGVAQLKGSSIAASGDTLNASFDTNANSWTYIDWSQNGGDPNATGTHQASGGNPNGYVNINLPSNLKNTFLGGFWQQSFTTTAANPTGTCEVDWRALSVTLPADGVDELFVAVYLDAASGEPTLGTEVLKKNFTTTFAWESHSGANAFDCSSKLTTAGTYYYKIAVWIDGKNKDTGPITVGFDNAKVHWEKIGAYPTDRPTITPVSSFTAPGVVAWTSFAETATKNGGQIYYQLSNDNGSTWQYWNGSTWAAATLSTNYNTASVVNTTISSFPTTNQQISFKAFLESDGTQLVQLDAITIGLTPATPVWGFATWGVGGGEVTPTGAKQTNGNGNPTNYAEISVPSGNNDEVGGVWTQSFVTTGASPTATLAFDYRVFAFTGTPSLAELRLFVDTASGDPVNQVAAIPLTGTTAWTTAAPVDISVAIATPGTYYLKAALWIETPGGGGAGPFTIGYDNVQVQIGTAAYATSGFIISSAFSMSNSSPVQVLSWDQSIPSCTPACQIRLQLSTAPDAGGSPGTFTAWYGPSGSGTYFTTNTDQLVPAALNGNQWVRYRAEFTGDGVSTPVLQEVRVNYK